MLDSDQPLPQQLHVFLQLLHRPQSVLELLQSEMIRSTFEQRTQIQRTTSRFPSINQDDTSQQAMPDTGKPYSVIITNEHFIS